MKCIFCKSNDAVKDWYLSKSEFEKRGVIAKTSYHALCFCESCHDFTKVEFLDDALFDYWKEQKAKKQEDLLKQQGPKYYTWHPKVSAVEVSQHFTSNLGQAIQYIWRSNILEQTKGQTTAEVIVDLEKAVNFINFEIARLKEL